MVFFGVLGGFCSVGPPIGSKRYAVKLQAQHLVGDGVATLLDLSLLIEIFLVH